MDTEPIFIGGMYRSGTSLLRAMLGRHSCLYAGLETQWLYEDWTSTGDRRQWLQRLSSFYDASVDVLEEACGSSLTLEPSLDAVMQFLARRAGKSRWIEKTPGNVGVIDRILQNWPRARVLHIVRDPRDVYASHIEAAKWTEPEEFAERWCNTVGAAADWLKAEGHHHPAYFELRYERLVLAPVEETQRILAFLDQPWEQQVAVFDGQSGDFERVRAVTGKESTSLRRLTEPLSAKRVALWRHVLRPGMWDGVRRAIEDRGYGHVLDTVIAQGDAK